MSAKKKLRVEGLESRILLAANSINALANPDSLEAAAKTEVALHGGTVEAGPMEAAFDQRGAARKGADRPLKGSLSGSVNFLPTENCPIITTVADTSGTMSHLGKVESHWEHCPPIIEPFYTNGHAVFIAANGDELEAEYGGDFGSPFILDVVGGSGRFENATGTIIADFVAEGEFGEDGIPINPWTVTMDLSGTISYGRGADLADTHVPALAGAAVHGQQVERPFKIRASSTMVLQADGSYEGKGGGVATHLGRFEVEGWGIFGVGGSGVITAANGDEIYFDDTPSGVVTMTGGTGRFEGVAGEFSFALEMDGEPIFDPITGSTTMKFIWAGTGTIKY